MGPTQANKITRPHTFTCIDGHTCGNPVRLVTQGHPPLKGKTVSDWRQDFIERFDWVRQSLMYEPRGHDLMSGAFFYPPVRPECDTAIIYIEVSGCLPICGHGTIGAVTFGLEEGLISPKTRGMVKLDTPAGLVEAHYTGSKNRVDEVRLHNVPSFLLEGGLRIDCPGLGNITCDIAYGGNFYAIIEPQKNYPGLDKFGPSKILRYSRIVRKLVNDKIKVIHPEDETIKGVSHVQWTDKPKAEGAHGRNAVFYGDKAIDRSPCGTGTSARMAQLFARGDLKTGDEFIHESIIGTLFRGRVESETQVGKLKAIRPSIGGWAKRTGLNTITIDPADPLWQGFQVI